MKMWYFFGMMDMTGVTEGQDLLAFSLGDDMYRTASVQRGTGEEWDVCANEIGDYTDREWGTACWACRFVGITGAASQRFHTSITT